MALYEFWTSRNNSVANTAAYVGKIGRLFYDNVDGILKISDGATPGGVRITYPPATTTTIGGIKAGAGANVSIDGTLTIDTTGLPLSIGNLAIADTTIRTVTANQDLILESNGTGNVELVGNVHFHTTGSLASGEPFFQANADGQITIRVPVSDPAAGAVKIVGSTSGMVSPPLNTGVMLQVTGNTNDASRIYNDAIGGYAAFVGRRINGNVPSPTPVMAGDEIIRISSTGHNGTAIPGSGSARMLYQAKENYTTGAVGTNLSIWTTAVGSNVLVKTATFDRETGLTIAGNVAATNLTGTLQTASQPNITTVGTLGSLSVTGNVNATIYTTAQGTVINKDITTGNINAGNIAVAASGTITTPRIVLNDGGVRQLTGNTAVTLDFAVDSLVSLTNPTGPVTITLQSYTAGAVVRFIYSSVTARNIAMGVAAAVNSTSGSTTLTGTGGGANFGGTQSVVLTYYCVGGTAATTYVSASYI